MDFKDLRLGVTTACLLFGGTASAQFNNTALGVGPLFSSVVGQGPQYGLHFEYARYLESSFELFARAPVLLVEVPVGADTPTGQGRVFGTGLSLGARYLFHEDTLRPWVGLQLSSSVLITTPQVSWYLGGGPSAGLDWVVSDSILLGARGTYDVFVELNRPWRHQLGVTLLFAVTF
jgi:outer membrane protein